MDYITYSEKLEYLKWLIEKERTGTTKELAKKFEVSERTIGRMISNLRLQGHEIAFSKTKETFFLKNNN